MIARPQGSTDLPATAPRPRRRLERYVALALLPAAIAIAATLVTLRLRLQPPTLPWYVVDAGPAPVVVAGGRYRIVARPTAPVTGAVGARAFLLRGDTVRPWDPPFDVLRDGTVRIEGPSDALFAGVPPGPWEVAVAIGRPEVLPTAPNDVLRARYAPVRPAGASARAEPAGSWHLVVQSVRVEPAAPRGMAAP